MGRILLRTHPSAHTVSTAQHMCVRFLHALAHTLIFRHTQSCICTHTHTCNKYVHGKCMHLYEHAHTQHARCPAPNPFTETHTHKEKLISFHCISLQAPASPDSTNPICYNNCHTGRLECFFALICKELYSYHKNHSDAVRNPLL